MPQIAKLAAAATATALTAAIVATGAGAGSPSGATHLAIRHVEKGCHVWSQANRQSTALRLDLASGASLHIVNRDVVAHQLVQTAGPKLALRGHMMPGKSASIAFSERGVYQFKNTVIEMGPTPKVATAGPDNTLRLVVAVH